jgi:hypothetical protein
VTARAVADANLVAAFGWLVPALDHPSAGVRQFGGATAVVTGSEVAFFNPVLAFDPDVRARDVDAAIEWVDAAGVPCGLELNAEVDPAVLAAAETRGFEPDPDRVPVLTLDPIPPALPAPLGPMAEGVTVRTGRAELFEDWHAAFGSPERFLRLFNRGRFADPGCRLSVAYLEGQPVASASLAAVPFFIAGGLKIVYDLLLYRSFRRLRPAEEEAKA